MQEVEAMWHKGAEGCRNVQEDVKSLQKCVGEGRNVFLKRWQQQNVKIPIF